MMKREVTSFKNTRKKTHKATHISGKNTKNSPEKHTKAGNAKFRGACAVFSPPCFRRRGGGFVPEVPEGNFMHGRRRLASALFRTVLPLGVSTHSDTQRPLSRSRHGAGFRPSRHRHTPSRRPSHGTCFKATTSKICDGVTVKTADSFAPPCDPLGTTRRDGRRFGNARSAWPGFQRRETD